MLIRIDFTFDFVAGATRAIAVGATTLDDKIGNDPMKIQAIVKPFFGQFDKVCDGVWSVGVKELNINGALFRFHDGFGHAGSLDYACICHPN
jgi:hypothetical protein